MLLINNHDQEKLLSMAECVEALESGYGQLASGKVLAVNVEQHFTDALQL